MPASIVEQYWSGVVRRLQAEVDVFNRLIGHAGEQGRENELALARLLESLLPDRIGVGTGIVIDSSNRRSSQNDVILFDSSEQPKIMAQVNQLIYPVEVVSAVLEVKTTLAERDLEDFAKKKASLTALQPTHQKSRPLFALFCYHAWAAPQTVAKHLQDMDVADRPELLCIVSPGVVGGTWREQGEFAVDFVPLHQIGESGERQTLAWRTFQRPPTGGVEVFEGVGYPVTRIPGTGYIVGEPGRALLLFADSLLRTLANAHGMSNPILGNYLDTRSRETLSALVE